MTKEDEDDYLTYCSEAMFRIHILEQRLQRYVLKDIYISSKIYHDVQFKKIFNIYIAIVLLIFISTLAPKISWLKLPSSLQILYGLAFQTCTRLLHLQNSLIINNN